MIKKIRWAKVTLMMMKLGEMDELDLDEPMVMKKSLN